LHVYNNICSALPKAAQNAIPVKRQSLLATGTHFTNNVDMGCLSAILQYLPVYEIPHKCNGKSQDRSKNHQFKPLIMDPDCSKYDSDDKEN
jgi:hypothetical protein